MTRSIAVFVGLLLVAVLVLFSTTYTVKYHEVAVRTRFGHESDDSVVTDPGLKWRLPIFADQVSKFDRRLRVEETGLENIKTADDQQIVVKAFLLWRVNAAADGPLLFLKKYQNAEAAKSQIAGALRSAVLSLEQYSFDRLIGEPDALVQAEQAIRDQLAADLSGNGVEAVAVGITRMQLTADVSAAVLKRMQSIREGLRDAETTAGRAQASAITSDARNKVQLIRAFADQYAEELRALGNEQAAQYLTTLNEEKDLAIFLAWLDALEAALSDTTSIFLDARLAPFHMLNPRADRDANGIPIPPFEAAPAMTDQSQSAPAADDHRVTRGGD
jgi:membrane protease subunit HflC